MNLLIRLIVWMLFLPLQLLLLIWGIRLPRVGLPRYYRPPVGRSPYRRR